MSDIKGYFASSKAGHDKGTVYMILESDDVYVYLSDGKLRPTDKLKKKKLKHVQLIKQKDSDLQSLFDENCCRDLDYTSIYDFLMQFLNDMEEYNEDN